MTRTCTKCGAEKQAADFHRSRNQPGGRHSWCKSCANQAQAKWRAEHGDVSRARAAAWRDREKEAGRYEAWRLEQTLRLNYGMTVAEHEALFAAQGGKCAICAQPERARRGGTTLRLSVDHDHESGVVRGLLCADCNRAIGLVGDDPALLRAAALYLERARGALRLVVGDQTCQT